MFRPFHLLQKRLKIIILAGFFVGLLSFFASILLPLEYRADAQVLVISKSRYGVDPYTVVKSAERIGESIIQIIDTSDFFDKVVNSPTAKLDTGRFVGVSERTKRKRWKKTVDASVVFGTGVLNISTYHRDPEEAKALANAVANTLVEKGWEYVGGDVTLKVVNQPVVTRFPARPNVPMNTALGFVAGMVLMSLWIIRTRHHII